MTPLPTPRNPTLDKLAAKKLELEIAELERTQRIGSSTSRATGEFLLETVNETNVRTLIRDMTEFAWAHPGVDITLTVVSVGGSVFHGFALYDFLTELGKTNTITVVGLGVVASMAGVILQAGAKRVLGSNAYVMVHEVSGQAMGSASEIADNVKLQERLWNRILGILASRTNKRPQDIKRRANRQEWWLDAAEAVDYGFADEVRA